MKVFAGLLLAGGCSALQLGCPRTPQRCQSRSPAVQMCRGIDVDEVLRQSNEKVTVEEVIQSKSYYADKLCNEPLSDECLIPGDDEFTVAILGDLHLDPRKMEDYFTGRSHFEPILEDAQSRGVATALVSLGDLGESKSVRPSETDELFAGTTECHELAHEFLSSFGVPYDVIGGNHDLEGIDEFATDAANLEAFLRIHKKPTMHFARQIAEKTLLVGMGSTVFRTAKYTSHEVTIDDEQLEWFEDVVASHPSEDGCAA